MTEEQKDRIWFFNLEHDGDSAIVRLLHSSVDKIESTNTHRIEVDGKKKRIKCLEEECPFCKKGDKVDKRVYIHLFDYTDNKEKVWDRTDKIFPELQKVQESWGPLNTAVVKITRKGDQFPKYEVVVLNPSTYTDVEKSRVDLPIAKFYSLNRKKEDVETFLSTGKFPEKPKFIPREEYLKQKETNSNVQNIQPQPTLTPVQADDDSLPF